MPDSANLTLVREQYAAVGDRAAGEQLMASDVVWDRRRPDGADRRTTRPDGRGGPAADRRPGVAGDGEGARAVPAN
jgi:ketosteroid isomerase-like protein